MVALQAFPLTAFAAFSFLNKVCASARCSLTYCFSLGYLFLSPLIRSSVNLTSCGLRSAQTFNFFDGQIKAKKMESREPVARSDINKEPSGNKSSVSPKVAATSSPTISRSAVPSAMLSLCPLSSLLPSPLSAPPLSALSPAPARRRRAQPTPSATADTARASEAGLTTPELRLYRPTT